jgi:hypothetical protein
MPLDAPIVSQSTNQARRASRMAEAQAEVPDAANLYPGRYAAVCTPGPIFGCVCVIDS